MEEKDKIEFKLELKFFLNCEDKDIEKVKEKLEDLGWWIIQETNISKAIKEFPNCVEMGYDVIVKEIVDV